MSGLFYRGLLSPAAGGGGGGGGGGCGVVLNTIYDDNFDCGSSPDTTGARFASANPWSAYHTADVSAATLVQSAGLLRFTAVSYFGGYSPRAILQSLPGGSGDWRFRTKFAPVVINPSFPLIGMILRESSTDKLLSGGMSGTFMETRRSTSWGGSNGNYSGGGTSGGGVGVPTWVEISRVSGNIECRMTFDATDGNDLTTPLTTGYSSGSHAQTADFTTAPDQWGICVVGDTADFDWVKKI